MIDCTCSPKQKDRLDGVMITVFAPSASDHGFDPRSEPSKGQDN